MGRIIVATKWIGYSIFLAHFREVFGWPAGTASVSEQLYHLQIIHTRLCTCSLKWLERALPVNDLSTRLEPSLRLHLSLYDDTMGLEHFIQLSIRVANRIQDCMEGAKIQGQNSPASFHQPEFPSFPEPPHEPMGLCLYCGQNGHVLRACPIRPPRPLVSVVSSSSVNVHPLSIVVQLIISTQCVSAYSLLDSGSAGDFISTDLCNQLQLKKRLDNILYKIQSITGSPLGRGRVRHCMGPIQLQVGLFHTEDIRLLVLEESTAGIHPGVPMACFP